MTRINVGVPPKRLSNKHLLAEHREIKRVPNMIKNKRLYGDNIPLKFTLGKGHVKFFYDKLLYLYERYSLIYNECINRGFNVQSYHNAWDGIDPKLMNSYQPTPNDLKIIIERINSKGGFIK